MRNKKKRSLTAKISNATCVGTFFSTAGYIVGLGIQDQTSLNVSTGVLLVTGTAFVISTIKRIPEYIDSFKEIIKIREAASGITDKKEDPIKKEYKEPEEVETVNEQLSYTKKDNVLSVDFMEARRIKEDKKEKSLKRKM